jgi:hypothetical protein
LVISLCAESLPHRQAEKPKEASKSLKLDASFVMNLLALWKFNLIPTPSSFWRREFKALSRKERVG